MIELNNIYNEDCLEGMNRIEPNSVDLIVTDPPYLHVKGGMTNKKMKGSWDPTSKMVNDMSDFGRDKIFEFFNIFSSSYEKNKHVCVL